MIYTIHDFETSMKMEGYLEWGLKHRPEKTKFTRDAFGVLISLSIDLL